MFNYPPTASALAAACQHVMGARGGGLAGFKGLLAALRRPANASCFNLTFWRTGDVAPGHHFGGSEGSVACSDWSGCGPGAGGRSWDYQACTEVLQPLGIAANSTMFRPHPWTRQWMEHHCARRFGVTPGFEHLKHTMGLDALAHWPSPARIIFSNGLQDPWHAGGVLSTIGGEDDLVAIRIPNGAHHQDLNGGASPSDTPDMLAARAQEKALIARWLRQLAPQ